MSNPAAIIHDLASGALGGASRSEVASLLKMQRSQWDRYVRGRVPGIGADKLAAWVRTLSEHGVDASIELGPDGWRAREVRDA